MKTYRDIQGDGGSNVVEQVVALRKEIRRRLESVDHVLAVGSGKGGVGKSTVVAQLARTLAGNGKDVAVLDADINGPSQARLFGVQGKAPLPGEHGLLFPKSSEGMPVISFGSFYSEEQAVEFKSVAHGESHTWRATREFSALAEMLAAVDLGQKDVLIVDLPPGAERTSQFAEFLGPLARFVIVTVPSELARGVVQRSLEALSRTKNTMFGVIENMSGYYCADCEEVKPLFPSNHPRSSWNILGRIPFDPRLAEACDLGLGLPENYQGPVVGAYTELADGVWKLLEEDKKKIRSKR